jgi:1-acyl-sn-glycerol-3-phosphate acyltransferase
MGKAGSREVDPLKSLRPLPRGLWPAMNVFFGAYFALGHRVEVCYHGRAPTYGPLVVMSNHPSFFDPWLVGLAVTNRYIRWMAWEEAFSWPVVGRFIEACRAFPVDLDRPKPSTLKAARALLDRGLALGVFPEGHRSSGLDVLDPFKMGAARLALATSARVLPVTISSGARIAWPPEHRLPRPGPRIRVTVHEPIDPSRVAPGATPRERDAKLTEMVRTAIASGLAR